MAVLIPHFDIPFKFVGGKAAVVEQDTLDDISNCVEAICRTIVGQRLDILGFGLPNLTFKTQPLPVAQITDAILSQEPRASLLISQNPDFIDQTIARVVVGVSIQEVTNA